MMTAPTWLDVRTAGAPAALLERARSYLAAPDGPTEPAEQLAQAGLAALVATVASAGDRSAALDLLAADALVTLALLARAERDPATLARFAAGIRDAGASSS